MYHCSCEEEAVCIGQDEVWGTCEVVGSEYRQSTMLGAASLVEISKYGIHEYGLVADGFRSDAIYIRPTMLERNLPCYVFKVLD